MATYGLQEIFNESVSATTATPSIALGTERWESGRQYRYVYNAGVTAAVGYGMIYSALTGYSVVISSAVGDGCAGVVVHSDIPASEYGWVAFQGFCSVKAAADSGIVAGSAVRLGANGVFATGGDRVQNEVVAGHGVTAIASAGTGVVYIG